MNSRVFILAQFDRKIAFVQFPQLTLPDVGEQFDRKPATELESWTVIKVFDGVEGLQIDALISLIGLSKVEKLFAVELPEQKSYEKEFTEAVSRMGGEA